MAYAEDEECLECGKARPEIGWPELRDSMDPWLGRVLEARYLLTKRIGQGASASVYRAESMAISRQFAIKIIHPPRGTQGPSPEQIAARLEREVEALGRLRNPHIVRFYDVIELPLQHIGVVMDFVEGETLESLVLRGNYLSVARACSLLRQIANGVYEAHLTGMTHRDLKPENVMVEQLPAGDDFVHVLDFGIVQVEGETSMTQGFIGTPLYASPEQAMGEEIDHRSDIYSLGAMFFFMLSGRPPFLGQNVMQVLRQHVEVAPPRIGELRSDMGVPEELEMLIGRMLAKTVENRPESLAEVIHQLDRLSYSTSEGRETVGDSSEPAVAQENWNKPRPASGETSPGVLPFRDAPSVASEVLEDGISVAHEERRYQTEPTSPPAGPLEKRSDPVAVGPEDEPRSGSGIFGRVRRATPASPNSFDRAENKSGSLSVAAAQSIPEQMRAEIPPSATLNIVSSTSDMEFAFTHKQELHVWNLSNGSHTQNSIRSASPVTAIAIARAGALIGRTNGSIEYLDFETSAITTLFESVFSDTVADLAMGQDGKLMFALMKSGRIYMSAPSKASNDWVRVRGGKPAKNITLSPRGDLIAVARMDGNIEVSRVAEPKQISLNIEVEGEVDSLAFTDDGYLLAISNGHDNVGLFQVLNGKKILDVAIENRRPLSFFFSKHNTLMGYVLEDDRVFVIDLQA